MESLLSVLLGGIAFDTSVHDETDSPSRDGTQFRLYDSLLTSPESSYTRRDSYLMYFEGSVRGLERGRARGGSRPQDRQGDRSSTSI